MQTSLHISLRRANPRSSENKIERWGALGSILAQARPRMKFWVLSGCILLKRGNFRLGETHSRSSEQILVQARLFVKKNT